MMKELIDFKERHRLKNSGVGEIFGYSASFIGEVLSGFRVLSEEEKGRLLKIIELHEAGTWQTAHRQLTKDHLVHITRLYGARFKRRLQLAMHLGIESSHFGKMLAGQDKISALSSAKICLRLALDGMSLDGDSPKQEQPQAPASAPEMTEALPAQPQQPNRQGLLLDLDEIKRQVNELRGTAYRFQQKADAVSAMLEEYTGIVQRELLSPQNNSERERLLVASRRRHLKECISALVCRLSGGGSDLYYKRVYNWLCRAVDVSRFDDIQTLAQAEKALVWVQKEAKEVGLILPAYQHPSQQEAV